MALSYTAIETNFGRVVKFYNNSGGTVKEGDLLVNNSGSLAVVANDNKYPVLGVVKTASVANLAYGEVWVTGVFAVIASGSVNFAEGDPAYASAATTVDDGTSTDIAVGYIVWADPAAADGLGTGTADTVYVAIHSFIYDSTTHGA